MISTPIRLKLLRRISIVSLTISWIGAVFGFIILVAFFLRPQLAVEKLYTFSKIAEGIGLGAILLGLLILAMFDALGSHIPMYEEFRERSRRRKYSWSAQILAGVAIVFVILFSAGILAGPRMVQLSHGKWISLGFSGHWEISASAARAYLWRDIGLGAVSVLIFALNIGPLSRALLQRIDLSGQHKNAASL